MFKRIPGTKDILPQETFCWQKIEEISRNIFAIYNYREIRPPLIEEAALFNRSLGDSTEIIQKQMFIIRSKQDTYALRPEGTASVARAYIENNLAKTTKFTKLYYLGPMFRLERPQRGRLREFHHIAAEAIGSSDAHLDVEIISLLDALLKGFSISGYKININSLGCLKDKRQLTVILHNHLRQEQNKLCEHCKRRFKENVLRVLDCKNEACGQLVSKINIKNEFLCPECSAHFQRVKEGLDSLKIAYQVTPQLVRGLDYYTRTVFEITHNQLGAQDALGAGGRYDNLIKELGGEDTAAVGFAFGVERLLLAIDCKPPVLPKNLVYLVALGDEAKKEGLKILDTLRKAAIPSDIDYEGKSIKGAMRQADGLNAHYVLLIGSEELKKGVVSLKNMLSGDQKEIKVEGLINELKQGMPLC